MILNETEARKLINLNPYKAIDSEIAERQFQVILKGFNYLIQEESDILYIADEVGLGKTYVGLGIASLLRHFSTLERRPFYKDVILVPKRNLQYKWAKEINNFVTHNYLKECNIVKSALGTIVGDCSDNNIHHHLRRFKDDCTSYEVYRNSSFSIATTRNSDWKIKLANELPDHLKPIFEKGLKIFKKESEEIYIKRLFAYLLNISFPEIDLLIVDEAHNFKHGIGDSVSYRNQIVSRLMGVTQQEDENTIFSHFPDLKSRITQKAKKIIFLSATPIDNGLYELKQQMDCFLPNHKFKASGNNNEEIRNALNTFMIRGLMKINLENEGDVSRNMYRYEHRRGNVIKEENAQPQYIKDDLESIIIGLLQLKTLQHFNESNNKSFEIGMLAGFETFKNQNNEDPEFEESTDAKNKAVDHHIIQNMASSYFNEFEKHLPHPKQDNLINVLLEGVKKGNKSLVFVRRIASVVELDRKLTHEIENWHYSKIKKYLDKHPRLKQLKVSFEERYQILEIENVLIEVSKRVYGGYKKELHNLISDDEIVNLPQLVNEHLITLYNSEHESLDLIQFRDQVKAHIGLKSIKSVLKNLSIELVIAHMKSLREKEDLEDEEQYSDYSEDAFGYFFSSYFSSKRYIEGFNFRKRASTKDWYRFNLYHLKSLIPELKFDAARLNKIEFNEKDKTDARRLDVINDRLKENIIKESLQGNFNDIPIDSNFEKKTFFNYLFEDVLVIEFTNWVHKKWDNPSKGYTFWEDLETLIEIIQGVFRNGSGLLPAYIAECIGKSEFEQSLNHILQDEFPEIIKEIQLIIVDFDKITTTNFPNRSRIQRAMYGQNPISGASGFHKIDISRVATQFRMPGYPYVLITTDVLKEGEDLHLYCKDVYHYGIAWNPSDMEQRTGRIDRINSSCYFELKNDGRRNFENALQVFYPYLANTLEVNQVSKVFHKMNDFIQTFYDVSAIKEKDTKVSIDEIVKEIPVQIKDFLSSKYDFENFKGISAKGKSELKVVGNVGQTKDSLIEALISIYNLIKSSYKEFYLDPKIDKNNLTVTANINLNGRRAPLLIGLVKGIKFNEIQFSVESVICRSSELRSRNIRDEIKNGLNAMSLILSENNDSLIVQKKINLDTEFYEKLNIIQKVIEVADNLESKYTNGGDLEF